MQAVLAACALLASASVAVLAQSQSVDQGAQSVVPHIDALFEPWTRSDGPGCAMAATRDGRILVERGYGMADLEQGTAIRPHTVFNMASVSKQFTAAAILLLAQDGVLSLSDDVRLYVPELTDYGRPITLRHLGHHTSGLRDHPVLLALGGWNWVDAVPDRRLLDLIARQKALNFNPGDAYAYSNTGYFLLALIVERTTGRSLGQFAAERIFEPLGMRHSRFYDDRRMIMRNRAVGHVRTEDGRPGVWRPTYEVVGDGALLTTVQDMALWEANLVEPRLGRDPGALIQQLVTPGRLNDGATTDYGFGLGVGEYRGLATVEHGGGIPGYATYMLRFPDQRFSVQVQCNQGGLPARRLARSVAGLFLADHMSQADPEADPEAEGEDAVTGAATRDVSRDVLAGYVGAYYSEELDATYHIALNHRGLSATVGYRPAIPLTPMAPDGFALANAGVEIAFRQGPDQVVTGFVLSAGRIEGIDFVRLEEHSP